MNWYASRTVGPGLVGPLWQRLEPLVPVGLREELRRTGQLLYSRNLRPADALLLSYPKSGSTWLRDMLATLAAGRVVPAGELARWSPPLQRIGRSDGSAPRIVRSHDRIDTPGFGRAGKRLVLVRDPRALVVSWAFHRRRREIPLSIEQSTEELLGSGFFWLGSWQSHVREALARADGEDVMILRYEDLQENTAAALSRAAGFLGIEASDELVELSVEAARPDALRRRRVAAGLEREGETISHVRNAKSEAWREECPTDCRVRIEGWLAKELAALGYGS